MLKQKAASHWGYLSRVLMYSGWIALTFAIAMLVIGYFTNWLTTLGIDFSSIATIVNVAISALSYLLMIAIAIGVPWLIWQKRTSLKTLGLDRLPNWKDIGLTLGGYATYFGFTIVLLSAVVMLVPDLNITEQQDLSGILPSTTVQLIAVFALLAVIGPIAEEVLFRGYMYGKIRRSGTPAWLTTLVVSLLFGAVHMQWNVGIDTFALSVVMCLTREISGSLWPSIMMHMTKNGLAFYLLFIAGIAG